MSSLLIDTSIIIDYLRNGSARRFWQRTLEGVAPILSPVTLHEIWRGTRPESAFEKELRKSSPVPAIVAPPPSTDDWILAADLIRKNFWNKRDKLGLALLTNDALIAISAFHLKAALWARDSDFKILCQELDVRLYSH